MQLVGLLLRNDIVPVLLDPGTDEIHLVLVQELQAESANSLLGEVHNDEIGAKGQDAGENTFKNENPTPASNTRQDSRRRIGVGLGRTIVLTPPLGTGPVVLELAQAVCEDTGKSRSHGADKIEDGIALLKLVARIPAAEKVGTACGPKVRN